VVGGPQLQPTAIDTCPPPQFDKKALPKTFVGAFSSFGKDTEATKDAEGKFVEPTGKFLNVKAKPVGQRGQPVPVVVNMMPLELTAKPRQLYRVDFQPEQELRRHRLYLLHNVLEDFKQNWAYDGEALLYAPELLGGKKEHSLTTQRNVTREQVETVVVTLRWASHQKGTLDKRAVTFFCTQFKAGMLKQTQRKQVGTDYFDFDQAIHVPEYLCYLVPGLDCTVYVTQCGPVLSIDMQHKHVRTDTVWQNMKQSVRVDPRQRQEVISQMFEHKIVLLNYSDPTKPVTKRTVLVDRVRWDLSPKSTFPYKKSGKEISYKDYMRERYQIKNAALDENQPLLENVSKREHDREGKPKVSHFIPSLCSLTGQTTEMKADTRRCRELMKHTALPPHDRLSRIMSNVKALVEDAAFKSQLEPWGLQIKPQMIKLTARRLPSPAVVSKGGTQIQIGGAQSWDTQMPCLMFRAADALADWAIVTYAQTQTLREFVDKLKAWAEGTGVPLGNPRICVTQGQRPADYDAAIRQHLADKKPRFVLVGVAKKEEPYKTVKTLLSGPAFGIPSQFVMQEKLHEKMDLKVGKVLVQMNVKGGGAPWAIDMTGTDLVMFVGLDVHHSGTLGQPGASVAGYVAVLDRYCTRFYSRSFLVKSRQQILVPPTDQDPNLQSLTVQALGRFAAGNKKLPKYVVVYRDGGSEGELEAIHRVEVKAIQDGLEEARAKAAAHTKQPVDVPQLVFFVALKKIRTRFFAAATGSAPWPHTHAVGNPMPGTIIDTDITSNLLQEFYICCQHVNQGSATPTKYQKIADTSDLKTDVLQQWTYNLAHMYYNWYGTVRVPAPMMYASALAKYVGTNLRGHNVHQNLHPLLHYL
jgi:aubergine-like protein